MSDQDAQKKDAAVRAVARVESGMLVGLGTGTTATFVVMALAERIRSEGLAVQAVATSDRTAKLAWESGIRLLDFEQVNAVDLAIDGADEVDIERRAIKGGGGALFREKVVAASAKRMIVVVDESKSVGKLGRFPLPIEVVPFAASFVMAQVMRRFPGVAPVWRSRFKTDQGNYILDLPFGAIEDPRDVADELSRIPGVLEHGLFLDEIDEVIVGHA